VNSCPDCDPILAAGLARCPTCGHVAYPVDAEWLPSGGIIASYPAACEHLGARTWLIDLFQLTPGTIWCNGTAVTTGALCRNRARPGEPYCWQHDPARRAEKGSAR
jgi:hypothetical protein